MKIFNKISMVALISLFALTSCTLEREKTIVDGSLTVAAEFTSYPSATITLDKSQKDATQVVFGWNKAQYSYPAAVTYSLEAYTQEASVVLASTNSTSIALQTESLNALLVNNLGATPEVALACNVRLLCSLGATNAYDTVSLPVPFTVIPFSNDATPLYVVGAYNGWSHDNDIAIWSEASNGIYKGYIPLFPDGVAADELTPFVLTPERNWTYKYASVGGDFAQLADNTGDDIQLPAGYLYEVEVDLNTLVGTVVSNSITRIGLVGDATPNGWEIPDTELVWTPADRAYVATGVAMVAGGFKFRANDDWAINWGAGSEAGTLSLGGDNITFDLTPGTYTVKLDLFQVVPTFEFIAE